MPSHRGMLSSTGLPERNLNRVPIASSDGYLLIGTEGPPVAGYNRYASGWPNVEGSPGRFLPHGRSQQLAYVTNLRETMGSPGRFLLHGRPQQLGYVTDMRETTGSPRMVIDSLLSEIFMDYMADARRMHGSIVGPEFSSVVDGFLRTRYGAYMNEVPGRTIHR